MAWVNRQRTRHGKMHGMGKQVKNDAHNYQLIHKLVVKFCIKHHFQNNALISKAFQSSQRVKKNITLNCVHTLLPC